MFGIYTATLLLILFSCAPAFAQGGRTPAPSTVSPASSSIDKLDLGATMRLIQDKLNAQGKLSFQAVGIFTPAAPSKPVRMVSETSFTISDALTDAGRCTLALRSVDESRDDTGARSKQESSVRLSLRDVESLEIQSVIDGYKTGVERNTTWDVFPPTFILHILLNSGKSYQDHSRFTDEKGVSTETEGEMRGGFWLYFGEEDAARQIAEAMERAADLCNSQK